ncbi:MAG: hypothetical protein DMG06_20560 [Acidobacteria bacterium]|nr:MAG: hypothetical protein DMG06_20560 [Acidobacteriota bacterium]
MEASKSPKFEQNANCQQKQGRQKEAQPESLKQFAVGISTHHARQVMPHGPEGADIKGDLLQGETRLRGNCERDDQDGGRNEQG